VVLRAVVPALLALVACGDDVTPPMDSGMDTAPEAAPDTGPLVSPIAEAAPPTFAPCRAGWREVAHPGLDGSVCEPWPESGRQDCLPHEMHLPGTPGCQRVGSECPSDGWPASLPPRDVVYVRADAAAGGDGSRASPFPTLAEAIAATVDGATIAVAVGEYEEEIVILGARTIVGACAEGVVLRRTGVAGLPIVQTRDGAIDIRDVTLRSDANDGFVASSSNVAIRSAVFDGVGISILGGDATRVEDTRVSGTVSDAFTMVGITGADTVEIARSAIMDTEINAVAILDGEASLSDVSIASTGGTGLQMTTTGSSSIERVVVEDTWELGLLLDGPMTVSDLVVRGVRSDEIAGGLAAFRDAELHRVWIEDAGDVAASMTEGVFTVDDLLVYGGSEGGYQRGLELGNGARIVMSRVVMASINDLAFLVYGEGTTLGLGDVRVEDVESDPVGRFGRCLHAQQGAAVTTDRTRFTRCREAAVTASHGASVRMRDAVVDHILPLGCTTADCPLAQAGIGFVALEGDGAIDVERFSISETALTGVQVIAGGGIDLRDGTIRNNPVGINVQVEGYDLARLMDRVVFEDNGMNLDTSELPVPAATVTR
jgi:hypothetical protein